MKPKTTLQDEDMDVVYSREDILKAEATILRRLRLGKTFGSSDYLTGHPNTESHAELRRRLGYEASHLDTAQLFEFAVNNLCAQGVLDSDVEDHKHFEVFLYQHFKRAIWHIKRGIRSLKYLISNRLLLSRSAYRCL